MKYIARYIIVAAIALTGLASCSSESYPGLEYEPVLGEDLVNNESSNKYIGHIPVSVLIGSNSFSMTEASRGTGPFVFPDAVNPDPYDVEHYTKSIFRVLAFRDYSDMQGYGSPDFTQRSSNENDPNCLIDGTDYHLGMQALLDADGDVKLHMMREKLRVDTTLYYKSGYTEDGYNDLTYNFFVYHLDDFHPDDQTTHRLKDSFSYDVELDGCRDFMVGTAPKLTPEVLKNNYPDVVLNLTKEETDYILNLGNYSRYAADRGIHPVVTLRHLLPRLRFVCYPADHSAKDVTIESITIHSRYKGELVVADADLQKVGFSRLEDDFIDLPLMERNPDGNPMSPFVPLIPRNNIVDWKEGMETTDWIKNKENSKVIGNDLLPAPAAQYRMTIVYTQKIGETLSGEDITNTISSTYTIGPPKVDASMNMNNGEYEFLPGVMYNVNIGIYGMRPLECTVGLESWEDGGDISVPGDPSEKGNE